jgi:hypothetical protein
MTAGDSPGPDADRRWRALVIPLFVTSLAGYTSGDQKSGTWTCAVPGWARAG